MSLARKGKALVNEPSGSSDSEGFVFLDDDMMFVKCMEVLRCAKMQGFSLR
jgi:hypothetical protein